MTRPDVLAAVGVGGAAGAASRYWMSQALHPGIGGFPWGTFWINVSGSFALGLVMVLLLERFPPTRLWRPLVTTGFLGGYTTFSTFAVETDRLGRDGRLVTAVVYAVASLVVGVAAVYGGVAAGRALTPRR